VAVIKDPIMVNGLPGNMATLVAEELKRGGFNVVPYSLTAEDGSNVCELEGMDSMLIRPSERRGLMERVLQEYPGLIAVDYTHPDAVNRNAEFYVDKGIPFVMGTTGGDREKLVELVKAANHPCVIAPNMAKQIVAIQAAIEMVANHFPGVLEGYSLRIVESHQSAKANASGTARVLKGLFTGMGAAVDEMISVRAKGIQINMGVPHKYLDGHGFHTYSLDNESGSVHIELKHNVCGREPYVKGTVDALRFLIRKTSKEEGAPFSMIDVLHGW